MCEFGIRRCRKWEEMFALLFTNRTKLKCSAGRQLKSGQKVERYTVTPCCAEFCEWANFCSSNRNKVNLPLRHIGD